MAYELGLVSISFRGHSPAQLLQAVKQAGLSCIEWGSDVHVPPLDAARLEEVVALQQQLGIRCSSYGTYFKLGETPIAQLPDYIRAAKKLGADILRLWCGTKNSQDYTLQEKEALFALCRQAADLAAADDVILCMECHNNTYTNRKEAALELMQAVDSPHFRMYWQPNQYTSVEENLRYATLLAPYTHHLHVFNWSADQRCPLGEAISLWQQYLGLFTGDRTLLLEFMPDDNIDTLPIEAQALKKIAGGEL